MSRIKSLILSPKNSLILISIMVLLAVWLNGYFHFWENIFFQNLIVRLGITGFIIVGWANYIIIRFILAHRLRLPHSSKKTTHSLAGEPILEQTIINDLKLDCSKVIEKSKRGSSWILLMGPPSCGKTTFLSQLPFSLTSPSQVTLTHPSTTQCIDWWIAEQAVFIDPAGKFALAYTGDPSEQIVWRSLIKILKKNRRRAPVSHILLMIDIHNLSHTNNPIFNDLIDHLIYQLQLLKTLPYALNVIFVITQSDRIVGFNEFFDDLSENERKQTFGFRVSYEQGNLAQRMENSFDEFIKNLSARTLWRMHHEHSLHKRGRIQEFPLQMEKLGQRLKTITTQMPWSSHLQLSGIYFISSLQHHSTIDFLKNLPVNETFGLQKHQTNTIFHEQQKFFIDQLVLQLLTETKHQQTYYPRKARNQLLGLLASILVISSLALFWHRSYQRNVSLINNVATSLRLPAKTSQANVVLPWLNQLNTLSNTLNALKNKRTEVDRVSGLDQSKRLLQAMDAQYQKSLQTVFLPYLAESLATTIEQNKHQNEIKLYNALKVYLLLSGNHNEDNEYDFIKTWFGQYWQQQFFNDLKVQKELSNHLDQLLQSSSFHWPINEVLVDQAQNELRKLPLVDRVFLKLQSLYSLNPVPILGNISDYDRIDISKAQVCSFCRPEQFNQIFSEQIPQIAKSFENTDFVLGIKQKTILSPLAQENLTKDLQNFYTNYYRQQWIDALPNIKIIPARTLSQAQHSIALLRNPDSEFWKILHVAYDNITLDQFNFYQNSNEDPSVNTLKLLLDKDSNLNQESNYVLEELSNYLFQLNQTTEIDKASYKVAVNRFQNNGNNDAISLVLKQAQESPPLMQSWLQSIALGAWQAILLNAREYLNTIWTTSVTPEYQEFIANRYPLFRQASDDVSLINFNRFFGPKGTLESFFNQYLKPFVNMDQNYWTFKTLDNKSIGIPQTALDMLIRASMIQQMFYMDNHQQIEVNFDLIPMKLGEAVSGFTLNFGGQLVQFNHDTHNDQGVFWPPQDSFLTLLFNGIDGDTPSITISGPWALFRLLDQSNLTSTKNAKEYQVRFNLKQYSADYLLIANHLVNPFIPGILSKFRCPPQL